MTDEIKRNAARSHFRTACSALDSMNWKYAPNEDQLSISTGARGDDLNIDVNIHVVTDRQMVLVISPLPFRIKEEKRIDASIAINAINNRHVDGFFDFDIQSGRIFWRINALYPNSILSEEAIKYLIMVTVRTVDQWNDSLMMLSSGMLSLEDLLKKILG